MSAAAQFPPPRACMFCRQTHRNAGTGRRSWAVFEQGGIEHTVCSAEPCIDKLFDQHPAFAKSLLKAALEMAVPG